MTWRCRAELVRRSPSGHPVGIGQQGRLIKLLVGVLDIIQGFRPARRDAVHQRVEPRWLANTGSRPAPL